MSWSTVIQAKSDQLNADDLISGDRVIKITKVVLNEKADQSATIFYDGDNGKPYKPCKSMRRVISLKWGDDETRCVGRYLVLTRDATVKWGGEEVGGIRITHMSDISDEDRFMITLSRGVKRPYKIERYIPTLSDDDRQQKAFAWVSKAQSDLMLVQSDIEFAQWQEANAKTIAAVSKYEEAAKSLNLILENKKAQFEKGE